MEFDINRLKEAVQFLKPGEKFVIGFDDVEVALLQGINWLHVGMKDQATQYRHGMNLDKSMQNEGNIEYWIFKVYKHMKERLEQEIDVNITQISNFVPNPPKMSNKPKFDDYLLYVGVLETHKGIKLLLNAFKDNQIKEKLVIIGKGTLEDYIEKFIKENRLENKINLLKWVDNDTLWNMYADAMAVVMPSTWEENAPLVALEALSVGTPVIGSEIGGIPEIIKKVDDQLILRSFPADLISAMKILENRQFSSSSIKEIWNKYYSPSAYIKEYNKLISRFDGARR